MPKVRVNSTTPRHNNNMQATTELEKQTKPSNSEKIEPKELVWLPAWPTKLGVGLKRCVKQCIVQVQSVQPLAKMQ